MEPTLEECTDAAIRLGVSEESAQTGTRLACSAGRQSTRFYHNVDHFNALAAGADTLVKKLTERTISQPLAEMLRDVYRLSARDHDVVYVKIDDGIAPDISKLLRPYITHENGSYYLCGAAEAKHLPQQQQKHLQYVLTAFGFEYGQKLEPFAGQNECLSALYSLEINHEASSKTKMMIAGMIHATIPFEAPDSVQAMVARLSTLQCLSEEELHGLGMAAADLANRDVANFAQSPEYFYANSLSLLREAGTNLKNPEQIAKAAQGMADFFEMLTTHAEAKPVFRNYRFEKEATEYACPSPNELEMLNGKALAQVSEGKKRMNAIHIAAARALRNNETELLGSAEGEDILRRAEHVRKREADREKNDRQR